MVICGSLSSLLLAAWNLFPVRQTCGLIEACSDFLQLKCESFLFQCDFNNNVLPERRMPFRKGKSGGKRDDAACQTIDLYTQICLLYN